MRRKYRELPPKEDHWMALAFVAAAASAADQQQGAVLVTPGNEFISLACNAPPKQLSETDHYRHAELNLLSNKHILTQGCHLYLTHPPCEACLLEIVSAGIKKITYYPSDTIQKGINAIVHQAYLQLDIYRGNMNWLRDHVKDLQKQGIFG